MPAASIRPHVPGGSAGADLRPSSQAPHLALVSASTPASHRGQPARNPQEAFGAYLRAARECRGIPLKTLAHSTKVTASLFDALERGDISRWPKGLYKRSFFRSYVAAIGLPVDSTLAEFLRLFPDEKPGAQETPAPPAGEPAEAQAPFRLTLAPDAHRLALRERLSGAALFDAIVVLVIAVAMTWWAGLDAPMAAVIVVLCYYPQLAQLLRREVRVRLKPHIALAALEPDTPQADAPADTAARVTASATS